MWDQVWQRDFSDKLHIRFKSHHARCGQCVKHRLILRRLGHQGPARRAQENLLFRHLSRQHRDRQLYWSIRAQSRLDSSNSQPYTLSCILDSMDQGKHAWPKSLNLQSKEFSSFSRPRLASTTLIIHGHALITALSPHVVTCNSSRSCEILMNGLSSVAGRLDMRQVTVHVQADNCSKEIKNNCIIKQMSLLTALGHIKACQLSFLSSGHSHEDVDGYFSQVAQYLQGIQEMWTPKAYVDRIQQFMQSMERRPHEKHCRKAYLLTQYRDWILRVFSEEFANLSFVITV